jgi:hypothetical protein
MVYLAGPITGLTYAGADDWRQYAEKELASWGIESLNPLRGKQYLADLGILKDAVVNGETHPYLGRDEWPLSMPAGITQRDRNDVKSSGLVLANFEGWTPETPTSIGTIIEIAWADIFRTPVVVVSPKDSVYRHAMLERIVGFNVETLEAALDIIPAILNATKAS